MVKHSMHEQEHYLHARLSHCTMVAYLVLWMNAKGEGHFAEHVQQKLEKKEHLSLLAQKEKERSTKSVWCLRLQRTRRTRSRRRHPRRKRPRKRALEHPCSGVFSVKNICVVASRAHWSKIKLVLPELSL